VLNAPLGVIGGCGGGISVKRYRERSGDAEGEGKQVHCLFGVELGISVPL